MGRESERKSQRECESECESESGSESESESETKSERDSGSEKEGVLGAVVGLGFEFRGYGLGLMVYVDGLDLGRCNESPLLLPAGSPQPYTLNPIP